MYEQEWKQADMLHMAFFAGCAPFVYQSCTHQQQPKGSMEGFFRFVEGTTKHPTGPAFDVQASHPCLPITRSLVASHLFFG